MPLDSIDIQALSLRLDYSWLRQHLIKCLEKIVNQLQFRPAGTSFLYRLVCRRHLLQDNVDYKCLADSNVFKLKLNWPGFKISLILKSFAKSRQFKTWANLNWLHLLLFKQPDKQNHTHFPKITRSYSGQTSRFLPLVIKHFKRKFIDIFYQNFTCAPFIFSSRRN